jgi:hypothetical protein
MLSEIPFSGAYMVRNLQLEDLPEVFASSRGISRGVAAAVSAGAVRKLGVRLYTTNTADPLEAVVRRHLWQIVGMLFPDSVVSHRTALEGRPTALGSLFLTGSYERSVELPGIRIRVLKGPGPLDGDNRFVQTLWLASPARASLECLRVRRIRGSESPALSRDEIETRLERLVRHGGEAEANALRDRARAIAPALGAERTFEELDELIGALLRTRTTRLGTPVSRARAAGEPYDSARTGLFATLHAALLQWAARPRPDPVVSGAAFENLAFIDAYFSNFIEGTEFEIEEAAEIVFENRIPRSRPEDAHDVLVTYRLVGDAREMTRSAASGDRFDDFLMSLRRRHWSIMSGRPEKRPGELKQEVNRAGLTVFVTPELVRGTLRQGFEMLRSLAEPFKRAAFVMFLVAEVHPFDDGNGRVARAMMNAELIAGGQRRIFIPTSYREDYLLALRALSRQGATDALVKMLDSAQAFSAAIDFADLQRAIEVLRTCNAFERDTDARLRMPP